MDTQPELRLVPASAEPADAASDESLMARHVKGDAAAFEVLVRRYADALLGFLVRMVRERTRAEDLFRWMAAGELRVRVGATFPLAQAADAHRLMESSQHVGKIVLTM